MKSFINSSDSRRFRPCKTVWTLIHLMTSKYVGLVYLCCWFAVSLTLAVYLNIFSHIRGKKSLCHLEMSMELIHITCFHQVFSKQRYGQKNLMKGHLLSAVLVRVYWHLSYTVTKMILPFKKKSWVFSFQFFHNTSQTNFLKTFFKLNWLTDDVKTLITIKQKL